MVRDQGLVTSIQDARTAIEELARRTGTFTDSFRQEAEEEAKKGRKGMLQAIECGDEMRDNLAKALKIISTDLYTTPARFLMEVIQNADDNKYAKADIPTVSITVSPKYVTLECNEEGFSRENIQALCRTARSSKKPGQGYTGEKGIGFKSVFKIADRAHIRSHPYYFQLDQTRELGMITPLWDEDFFDDYEEEHQTTIVLDRICDKSRSFSTTLENDVHAIDPVLLLFLRRIKQLHLTLYKSSTDCKPAISKLFQRVDWTTDSGIVSLKDENTNTIHYFYKQRHSTHFEGTETRRQDMTETDIVLIFPVAKNSNTYVPCIPEKNSVFAYLPLGDFGYKFVIQADFLTTSNRQSIDEDSYWNRNIAKAIPHAFKAAVENFNDGRSGFNELARAWPLYLERYVYSPSEYWCGISDSIKEHLSSALVIQDQTGSLGAPKDLMFLDWAHDHQGEPMFGHKRNYVSQDYPKSVRKAFLLLGVTAPNWKWVCRSLHELHKKRLLHIKMHSKKWCSDLAKMIFTQEKPGDDKKYMRDLKNIPLIPLADGTWRCLPSENDPIYFPVNFGTTIPPGLPFSLVEEEACTCPNRRKLFQILGIRHCDVPNVIERILDYHAKLRSAMPDHLMAQLKYLYKMREHLAPGNLEDIYFVCSGASRPLQKGSLAYVDISDGGELQQLFSGHKEAYFIDSRYFAEFGSSERVDFTIWLCTMANMALAPRFIATDAYGSQGLHRDFKWLLDNKSDQVLDTLHQYWGLYKTVMTTTAKETLAAHAFKCFSGDRAALCETYIPLRTLVEKTRKFGYPDHCHFLALSSANSEDWKFLSSLGVRLDDGLDFHLWVLNQSGFKDHTDAKKSKQLYLAIQSQAFSPTDEEKVKEAFGHHIVNIPNGKNQFLTSCVWHAPKGFSSKPALRPIYGHELNRLFREILKIPNVTSAEAQIYLETLRNDASTTMVDATEVYVFLQDHCAIPFDVKTACIAIPSLSGLALEWKTPAQCVWDDDEFSQNELELESKTVIRPIVEQYAPTAKVFFTDIIKIPNAGIDELLADLALMQMKKRDDPKRVHRLYERIESCRRRSPRLIMHVPTSRRWQLANRYDRDAFKKYPLVFLRGINGAKGRWLSLNDCIWTRSVLRYKYALMPTLNQYWDLFRDTLEVQNATMDMLVTDLLESTDPDLDDEDGYQYAKELVQEIARLSQNDKDLERLEWEECWPCRTSAYTHEFCSIESFYINDRQYLFDMFADSEPFLDFDFDTSKKVAHLLRSQGCDLFLSDNVLLETECHEPLERDHNLTRDFQSRADALVRYLEHAECKSPYELWPLIKNAEVWMSADIITHYTFGDTTVTKSDGGCSVKVNTETDNTAKLEIFVSANRHIRECALIADFPEQLVAALELEPAHLPDLHLLLQVPITSLKALLIKRGFTGGDAADYEETLVSVDEDSQNQGGNRYDAMCAISSTIHASARSEAADTAPRPHAGQRLSSRPSTPEARSQGYLNEPSHENSEERPVTSRPTISGFYSTENRNHNRQRLQDFARNVDPPRRSRIARSSGQFDNSGGLFDMSMLRVVLEATEPAPSSTLNHVNQSPRRQVGLIPKRNEEQMARDFEVGFLGEQFVYTLLHDTLELPDFTGEDNWTSSLRTRAGFSAFSGREVSDFTYKDTQGTLTRHFLQTQHSYSMPKWLSTACDNGNVPLYRLEVKSTTNQNHKTPFYMSSAQHKLAKKLRVTSAIPSEIYVVLRISGLDALEDEARRRPQWKVYLDPYTCGKERILKFVAPTYAVTPTA